MAGVISQKYSQYTAFHVKRLFIPVYEPTLLPSEIKLMMLESLAQFAGTNNQTFTEKEFQKLREELGYYMKKLNFQALEPEIEDTMEGLNEGI